MKTADDLTPRTREILRSVVQAYIETGEPVASRTISRLGGNRLSAASIRNIMADLADAGFLSQPHTSAGRIPTAKAFEAYVQGLPQPRHMSVEGSRLRQEIRGRDTVEAQVEHSSHVLMQISRSMGIAAAIPSGSQILDQVELVLLSGRRVLMIVATRDRVVRDKVVQLDHDITPPELHSIRNYLNAHFSGWTLAAVQAELRNRLEEERAVYDEVLRKLTVLVRKGLLDMGFTPMLHTEGAANLVGVDLHLTHEKMRDLFRALEEKKRILELLDRFLQSDGELRVRVGLSDAHPNMGELALIGVTVQLPSGLAAKIAVLGPLRMNYERVMAAVYHVGQALQAGTHV